MQKQSHWIIKFRTANLYLVDVPPTGFSGVKYPQNATKFNSEKELEAYARDHGVFVYQAILCND